MLCNELALQYNVALGGTAAFHEHDLVPDELDFVHALGKLGNGAFRVRLEARNWLQKVNQVVHSFLISFLNEACVENDGQSSTFKWLSARNFQRVLATMNFLCA